MRRLFIAQHDMAACVLLTFGLALHQAADAVGEKRDFLFLPRDDVGHVLHGFGQMGQLLFKIGALCHGPHVAGCLFLVQPFAKA